jgi:D-apiose dehydrogenase
LKFCVLGAGFWAQYQVAAWRQLNLAELVGIYDPDPIKASRFGVPAFDDPEQMLAECQPDFVDIITPPGVHGESIRMSLKHTKKIICQKPLAENLAEAEALAAESEAAGVSLFVHENWRFQKPLQTIGKLIQGKRIGNQIHRARFEFNCSFPVFANQPGLKNLERMMMADLGVHLFDTARSMFGEPKWVFARKQRINPLINGENMATVVAEFQRCPTVIFEMAYAAPIRDEAFPQTYLRVEGETGSLELRKDFAIHITSESETLNLRAKPTLYPWIDPAYDVVHSSIVDCNRALFMDMTEETPSGLRANDNLKTLRFLEAAYLSCERNEVVTISSLDR